MLMEIRDKEFAKIETSESNKKTHLTYDVFLMAPNFAPTGYYKNMGCRS